MKKNKFIKWLCLSLALIMLILTFSACRDDNADISESDSTDNSLPEEDGSQSGEGSNEGNGENNGENNGGGNGGENNTTSEDTKLDCIALTYGKYGNGAVTANQSSVYTVDESTGVVTVAYSSAQQWSTTRYIFKAKFPAENVLQAKYRFVRVVYAAINPEGSTPVRLMLRNDGAGNADDLVLDTINEDTDGYVVSQTAMLNIGLLQRYIEGNHNSLYFESAAEGGMYYIKGIYFFPTQAEANKFTAAHADKMLEDAIAEEEANKVPDGPTISMLFGTDGNAVLDLKESQGIVSNTVNSDGDAEISHCATKFYSATRYMAIPKFKDMNTLTDRYQYIRIQYSAANPTGVDTVKMLLRDTAAGSVNDVVLNTAVQSTSGFSLTKTAKINSAILTRFTECKDNAVIFETNTEGGLYKIRAIYFFTSEEAANAFSVEGVPEDKSIPFCLSFGTSGNAVLTTEAASNYTSDAYGVKLSYAETQARSDSNYVLKPKFPSANADIAKFKYVRVVYSAANPTGTSADMVIWNNATGQTTVLAASVSNTEGTAITDTVELKEDFGFMTRFSTGGYNTIFFKTTEDGGEYTLYKIYFFDTKADADAFSLV